MGPALELGRYLAEVLAQRRREPCDDLLSALLAAEIDGQRLSEPELIGFAFLLLVAGNETTTNLISNAAILLDRHRDQRRLLVEDPARISGAVEEFLRYDSPVQGLARVTTAPVTLHGVTIPEGGRVLLLFGSANRDERKLSDPERFDVLRDPNPHVAFGFGAHFCLGANLARLEARVAFEELLARLPDYRMTESRVERTCSGPIRGALSLPVAAAVVCSQASGPFTRRSVGGRRAMEIFAGLSVGCLILAALVVATKTFALWARTRGLPELLLSLYLSCATVLGYPLMIASTQIPASQMWPLHLAGLVVASVGFICLLFFTLKVFRPEALWARCLVGVCLADVRNRWRRLFHRADR